MGTTYASSMGDRGRLVVPAELRTRQHWESGTALLFIEADNGVILMTREQAKRLLREQLAAADPVGDLLRERREAARQEDAS